MLPILFSVVVISFTGVMMPGPMFAITVAKSYRSPWTGVRVSLGHAVIEVPIILLIYFGFARFFENTLVQIILSILGGGMIIWMGIAMFRVRNDVVRKGEDLPYGAFFAGIVSSGLNPYFLLWWVTIGSLLVMKFSDFGASGLIVFIVAHWLCDLVWLSLVSVTVFRTRSLWGLKLQERLFIAFSLVLIGFGVWFLVSGLRLIF